MTATAQPAPALVPPISTAIPPTEIAVRLESLTKRFPIRRGWRDTMRRPFGSPTAPALTDVSCAVRGGEFFGLLGPNGAGKTTLFKILATLVLPDEGTATVAGCDVVREADAVRRVLTPVITDERSLYWRLPARENLLLYARLQGLRGAATHARAEEMLGVVGLRETGEKMVGAFSSGMRQRLLIARALLARPRVLLLDEPTRSLDPIAARSLRAFLREELSERQGCTVLLATHSAEEVLELCGRVAVLDRGRLLATGTTEELIREAGDERYRLLTRSPAQARLLALARDEVVRDVMIRPADDEGWSVVELRIAGGPDAAAEVVDALARGGVPIARFERIGLSLASLIERIVDRRQAVSDE